MLLWVAKRRRATPAPGCPEADTLKVARIQLAPWLSENFERVFDHLARYQSDTAASGMQDIFRAIDVLERNPLIGGPVEESKRELIIGRSSRGYVALYRHGEAIATVLVLALRSQREAGDARE